jgi:predicted nuclease of restriction endonuclease-like (RecB) superfamily
MKKTEFVPKPVHKKAALLAGEISKLIESAKRNAAVTVNRELLFLYWHIGKKIIDDILHQKRAKYGHQIISTLSQLLTESYGSGYSKSNLSRMTSFYETFNKEEIVATLSQHLSWSHFIIILPLKKELERQFYASMCFYEKWSVRVLRKKIDSMLFERTALSKKPGELIRKELAALITTDTPSRDLVFKSPYILDFLDLKGTFTERDLEQTILNEIEQFLLELGKGFTFIARQKRMIIDGDDFYLDLLFYHRKLKCLVAIDLKIGRFKAAYKGQMELYLRWLERYETEKGENSPIGLILCAEGSREQIELLQLSESSVRVGEYLTELPPKEILAKKLHASVLKSKKLLENMAEDEGNN